VPDVQLIADYLVEDFEAMRRAHEALSRADAIEIIEIAAAEHATVAKPVDTPARPKTQASPTAASANPGPRRELRPPHARLFAPRHLARIRTRNPRVMTPQPIVT
jgi:hypothetical protein